jgi:hypothetical protein
MWRSFLFCSIAVTALLIQSCVLSGDMQAARDKTPTPASGKALVVFIRPSELGPIVQSEVFELSGPKKDPSLIAIVSAGTKYAYQADSGDHVFMVQSEGADFALAHLAAGKTYYILIQPIFGIWQARFLLEPIHKAQAKYSMQSPEFTYWITSTEFVEQKPSAQEWFQKHRDAVVTKEQGYWNSWVDSDPGYIAQHTLTADDGN